MGGESGKDLTLSLIWLTFFGRGGGNYFWRGGHFSGRIDIFWERLKFFREKLGFY